MRLVPFDRTHAGRVLSWARTPAERRAWASLDAPPGAAIFETWLADPDVHAYLLEMDGTPVAYGELWVDADEDEVELAHILVAPERRDRGVGRAFVERLLAEAERFAVAHAWVRVAPENAPALRCYGGAGFAAVPAALEAELNAVQPRAYRWMRRPLAAAR